VPQYHVIYHSGAAWQVRALDFRKTPFTLGGQGTKHIPIARPQIMLGKAGALLVFRDEERGSKVSVASARDVAHGAWQVQDLTASSVGAWEPSYDTELWRRHGILSLFVQNVQQVDGEGQAFVPPSAITVLDWTP
jgi:hypothetical protein